MKRYALLSSSALMALILSGCISPGHEMKSLVGKPAAEIIARWGPPNDKAPDGQGGETWTYFVQRQWTTPGEANTTVYGTGNANGNVYGNPYGATYSGSANAYASATTTWTPPQTQGYRGHRTFFIDSNGIVYRWGWRGL